MILRPNAGGNIFAGDRNSCRATRRRKRPRLLHCSGEAWIRSIEYHSLHDPHPGLKFIEDNAKSVLTLGSLSYNVRQGLSVIEAHDIAAAFEGIDLMNLASHPFRREPLFKQFGLQKRPIELVCRRCYCPLCAVDTFRFHSYIYQLHLRPGRCKHGLGVSILTAHPDGGGYSRAEALAGGGALRGTRRPAPQDSGLFKGTGQDGHRGAVVFRSRQSSPVMEIVVGMIPFSPRSISANRSMLFRQAGRAIFMAPFCNAVGPRSGLRRYSWAGPYPHPIAFVSSSRTTRPSSRKGGGGREAG